MLKSTVSSSEKPEAELACESLVRLLKTTPLLTEIVIAPESGIVEIPGMVKHGLFFVMDSDKLVLPVKALQTAYIVAIKRFGNYLSRQRKGNHNYEDEDEDVWYWAKIIILLNPDHETAVNFQRRRILLEPLSSKKSVIEQELDNVGIIMAGIKSASKSSTLWKYRKWLLQSLFSTKQQQQAQQDKVKCNNLDHDQEEKEINLCLKACSIYPRNFYAWSYRSWLVLTVLNDSEKIKKEWIRMQEYVNANVSDHSSCVHMENVVMQQLDLDLNMGKQSLAKLLNDSRERVELYGEHETVWMHWRRLLEICKHYGLEQELKNDIDFVQSRATRIIMQQEEQQETSSTGVNWKAQTDAAIAHNARQFLLWNKIVSAQHYQ